MSSNDSMSSSRLSQFGLYRTIDARTEEFLKLSRKRQIRQGCACAAVSTAITVTVVVSMLLLYGYGVGSSSSADLRSAGWLDLLNDSSDVTLFEDRHKNTIQLDRAAMNLLPVLFDKILEYDTSSPKYETKSVTEYNFEKDTFAGSNVFAKIPNSRLFTIQYKTYPIVYIHSPRNTDNYLKMRKTRDYERIMNYIEKMINEKVGLGSNRFARNQPSENGNIVENLTTTPMPLKKTLNLNLKNYPHLHKITHAKLNTTINDKKKTCKCHNHFGLLLNKLIKCFQELSKDTIEQADSNVKEKITETKCCHKTKEQLMQAPLTTTGASVTSSTTPKSSKRIMTSTSTPTVTKKVSDNFLHLLRLNNSKLKSQLLKQSPSSNLMSAHNKTKCNVFHYNKTQANVNINKFQNNFKKDRYTTSATTSTSTTTTFTTPYDEDIFQEILFPEGNVFEVTMYPQKRFKYDYDHAISKSRHYEVPEKTHRREPIKPQVEQQMNVIIKNISKLIIEKPLTPKYPIISPEEYVFERFRKKHDMVLKHTDTLEPKNIKDNTRTKSSDKSMIDKFKDLLWVEPPRKSFYKNSSPRNKNFKPYSKFIEKIKHINQVQTTNKMTSNPTVNNIDSTKRLTLQNEKTTTKTTLQSIETVTKATVQKVENITIPILINKEDISKSITQNIITTRNDTFVNVESMTMPSLKNLKTSTQASSQNMKTLKSHRTTTKVSFKDLIKAPLIKSTMISTSSTLIPPVREQNPVPTQLSKYSKNHLMPEVTTSGDELDIKPITPYLSNIPTVNDIWNEFDVEKTPTYENIEKDSEIIISLPTKTNITKPSNTTSHTTNEIVDIENEIINITSNISKSLTGNKDSQELEVSLTTNSVNLLNIAPIGRKSYLEISRNDWNQNQPNLNSDVNIMYDIVDEVDE